jgi:L-iditol 2-dehydrogenase
LDALEAAKGGWEALKSNSAVTSVEGLSEGFDAVFECTGVESCMQLAPMVRCFLIRASEVIPDASLL